MLSYFVANLSKTLHITFYRNRSILNVPQQPADCQPLSAVQLPREPQSSIYIYHSLQ